MAITVDRFAARHPVLLHMAHRESWPSIRKHGLLSTSALLELFGIAGEDADSIRSTRRAKSIEIHHPAWGSATIRDQKPMTDSGLNRALTDDLRPRDWYRILNSKVFFWPSEGRLQRMMGARPYREQVHIVLVMDTSLLLQTYRDRVALSPLNSGTTQPMPHPRGRGTFQSMDSYPYWERKRQGKDPVAEVAIDDGVEDVERFVVRVECGSAGPTRTVIWTP